MLKETLESHRRQSASTNRIESISSTVPLDHLAFFKLASSVNTFLI